MNKAGEVTEMMERMMNEMATVYRTGPYAFVVYNDHIPPYFHILQNGKIICKVVIPPEMPQTIDDILIMKTDLTIPITNKFKKMILSTLQKEIDDGLVYRLIRYSWRTMNENNPVETYDYSSIKDYIL